MTWKHVIQKDGQEEMSGYYWLKCQPFKAGQRLDGNYERTLSTGGATNSRTLRLSPDGTYTQKTTGSVRAGGGLGGAVAQSEQKGTYKLDGYTIVLTETGGTTTRHGCFIGGTPKDSAKPDMLFYDGVLTFRSR